MLTPVYVKDGHALISLGRMRMDLELEGLVRAEAELLARRQERKADVQGVHYEGMHLDTHPGLHDRNELLRMLFNFSEHPRKFQYALTDRHGLVARGVQLDRKDYTLLELPGDIGTQVVEIPGRVGPEVHFLQFWASVVPHVGITEGHGYFLVSLEALRERVMV